MNFYFDETDLANKKYMIYEKYTSTDFTDALLFIKTIIFNDYEVWDSFESVLFAAMKKKNRIFYINAACCPKMSI